MPTALDVAAWFVGSIDRDAGDSITHLKLQKLVYYAQAWSLAIRGEPIFAEDLQAWAHGPVAESVFHAYKGYGWDALPAPDGVPEFDRPTTEILDDVLAIYGDLSAKHLERLTHREFPWRAARGTLPPEARSSAIITKDSMRDYYADVLRRSNEEAKL